MFLSRRISTPFTGKREIAADRLRNAAGIMMRNGALAAWTQQVLGGYYSPGTLLLHTAFDSMEHSMTVGQNLMSDPAWAKLMLERELSPSAEVVGPELFRRIAGENGADDNEASMVREYVLPRENIASAVALLPEAQKMLSGHSVNVTMWAPVIAADMQRFYIVYSGRDITALGKAVDEVGVSKEFQDMLVKASQLGTLDRAWMMTTLK
jgi:hypothetical protein